MGSAYTPGLTVTRDIVVHRRRRLPIEGDVLVSVGDKVGPTQVVARAMLPGPLQTIRLNEKLGVEAREVSSFMLVQVGDGVEPGQLVAETKGIFGKLFKSQAFSDVAGVIEAVSEVTGHVLVREPSVPVEVGAYIAGTISEVEPNEGAVVETRGAMVQGIFGVGGERHGLIRVAVAGPDLVLQASDVRDDDQGKILVGGSGVTYEAIEAAVRSGAAGIVVGAVKDVDLTKFLGYDIGVAITGQEQIALTLVCTEGFGVLNMAGRTFELLQSLEGKDASINGATQIRAGVIRPEVIVPLETGSGNVAEEGASGGALEIGVSIRVIREPYFGLLGKVTDLPSTLVKVDSGAEVRVLRAQLDDGRDVTVPRANVEIIVAQ
ncbi:MAG: hypothetical protein AB7F50_03985 [Fimbriimonadaceae bacterium]